jgi:hypothetical protein
MASTADHAGSDPGAMLGNAWHGFLYTTALNNGLRNLSNMDKR